MSVADIGAAFRQALDRAGDYWLDDPVVVAVSGGGDSIALMHLATQVIAPELIDVITVDHGLRPEAADEIALVAGQAKALGLRHTVLRWEWDGRGNLQSAARDGRFALITAWANDHDCDAVFLGHTADDQVETFLMRLARGSGVDGLAAMSAGAYRDGLRILRPLLDISRQDLRDWLKAQGVPWCDDPSNDDLRFDRVRARQMLPQLAELGLTSARILQSVDHMQAARHSLRNAAHLFAANHVRQDHGDLILDRIATDLSSDDLPRRAMAAGLGWIAGRAQRPRFARLLEIVEQVREGGTATFAGCVLLPEGRGAIRMTREAHAAGTWTWSEAYPADAQGVLWDDRWVVVGPIAPDLEVRPLANGIGQCHDWRDTGVPRVSLLASPSIWQGDTLIAAPLAGLSNCWTARIVADFHEHAFAH